MKNEQKIQLSFLKERLQARMSYRYPDFAFDVLLYGWCKHRKHTTNWLSDVKRRGWITLTMARDFANYCGYMFV
jgi:site-specific recombinase